MKKLDPQDWSPFWKNRSITSFGELFPDNYDGPILDFWRTQLEGQPAHVVDLACGNGALTWICNDILNHDGKNSQITGVDFADISPFKVLRRKPEEFPAVRFIGNTPIERLPFPDRSVDLFVSQYGLEYANLEEAVPEIGRKISASGRLALILHDCESSIIRGATEHLDDLRRVAEDIRMHDMAFELDKLVQKHKNPARRATIPEFNSLLAQIRLASGRVDDMARHHPGNSPLHLYVRRLNMAFDQTKKQSGADRKKLITQARDALLTHIRRVEDLSAAALSESGRERLVALLEAEGLQITGMFTLEYKQEKNIGTTLSAARCAP